MKRGTLIGSFTFREKEHGESVLLDYKDWKDQLAWMKAQECAILQAIMYLEQPCSDEERVKAYSILHAALSRKLTDCGFEERREARK